MRILVGLQNPGYLRHYAGTLSALAERGHDVALAFDSERRMREGLAGLDEAAAGVRRIGLTPQRRDAWAPLATHLRLLADFLRFLDPRLEARYLRERQAGGLDERGLLPAPVLRRLARRERAPLALLRPALRALVRLEAAVPASPAHVAFLRQHGPDVLVLSPLVQGHAQADLLAAARRLGIPTVLAVASWDHLTTKGLVRATPDRVLVWNEIQREEASAFHFVPPERVVVTGAQSFDPWFGRRPALDREAFCARVGLPPERRFVLFTGSFRSITTPAAEQCFARAWIEALRARPALRDLAVLVRPHPYNSDGWERSDLEALEGVRVWDHAAYPVDEASRSSYFDSLHHAAAIVGVNTSAMLEGAIVGRPVLSVVDGGFTDTQGATLHFRYLLPEHGGFLLTAEDLGAHAEQLERVLAAPAATAAAAERFVAGFVRPRGLDLPVTPLVADAVESAAGLSPAPRSDALARWLLLPFALAVRGLPRPDRERLSRRAARTRRQWAKGRARRAKAWKRRLRRARGLARAR